jgi:4-oxalocrotonate tautomerase
MPHVVVKLWPGKSGQQKKHLTQRITAAVTEALDYGEESVSIAFEEVNSREWKERVYTPDIRSKWEQLYKKSGHRI